MQTSRAALRPAATFTNFKQGLSCTNLAKKLLNYLRRRIQLGENLNLSPDLQTYLESNAVLNLDVMKTLLTTQDLHTLKNYIKFNNFRLIRQVFGLIPNDMENANDFTEHFVDFLNA